MDSTANPKENVVATVANNDHRFMINVPRATAAT